MITLDEQKAVYVLPLLVFLFQAQQIHRQPTSDDSLVRIAGAIEAAVRAVS